MEDEPKYNIEKIRRENAALRKYAIIQKNAEEKIGCQAIYIDITGDLEAAFVLDELIFFTLPRGETGKSALRVWKDGVLWMAVRRAEWWNRKRLTPHQADGAIQKLLDQKLIFKKVFKFDGQPTVHLRLNAEEFFRRYGEETEKANTPENQDDTIFQDLSDLYEMMGVSPNPNFRNGETESPNGETESPKVNFLNSPDSSSTKPFPTARRNRTDKEQQELDAGKIKALLGVASFPGAKREARVQAILDYTAKRLNVRTTSKEWREFAKDADTAQIERGDRIDVFFDWLLSQKGFDLQYWRPAKMSEFWPKAFVAEQNHNANVETDSEGIVKSW